MTAIGQAWSAATATGGSAVVAFGAGHMEKAAKALIATGKPDVQELAECIAAAGAVGGVVCIDTLNRAAPGADENSSQDTGLIIEAAKAL